MKIRYLSDKDKQTLHRLRNETEIEEIAQILEAAFLHEPTIHAMWEYRKWFLMLAVCAAFFGREYYKKRRVGR